MKKRNQRLVTKPSILPVLPIVAAITSGCMDSGSSVQYDQLPVSATASAVRSVRPGLAVRGMACLACHANVQASVITDFGYGDTWYLDHDLKDGSGKPYAASSLAGYTHYNPYTWQSLDQVAGRVVVPSASVPADVVQSVSVSTDTMSLDAFLMANASNPYSGWWLSYFDKPAPASMPYTSAVQPGADAFGTTLPKVAALEHLYIGAPTADQIRALSPTPPAASVVSVQTVDTSANIATEGLPGLSVVTGVNGQPYVRNTGALDCVDKDVVIQGTLLLSNAQVNGGRGCRLYVTGPVFIQGGIAYADADPLHNLQISSATAITLGVGLTGDVYNGGSHQGAMNGSLYSHAPLYNRLIGDARNMHLRSAPDSATYATWANGVVAEGTNIGADALVDASTVTGAAQTAKSAIGQVRTAINYERLLLNAPLVHSRYMGVFRGIIIAEEALFSLGEFNFAYDDVFSNDSVPILPALGKDVLCASGSDQGCRPVVPSTTLPSTNIGS